MYISDSIVIIEIKCEQCRFHEKDVIMEAIMASRAAEVWHSGPTFLSAPSKTSNTYSVCLPYLRETVKFI